MVMRRWIVGLSVLAAGCTFKSGTADTEGDDGDSTGGLTAGTGSMECESPGSHSSLDDSTDPPECTCEAGYDWCNLDDPDDFRCCTPDGECDDPNSSYEAGYCVCNADYEWCNPDDADDLSCCETGDTGTGTGGGMECPSDPPPATCDAGAPFWCTSTDEECPGDFYECQGGEFVPNTTQGNEDCMYLGDDFAYGCFDSATSMTVEFVCGRGPGTDCSGDTVECVDADVLGECRWGKRSEDSCARVCQEQGDGMAMYDWGECGEQDGMIDCLCCDFGDPGCDGGTGSTGG